MADTKLRLGSKTKYTIDVNDNGDTISIDLGNPDIVANIHEMLDAVNENNENHKELIEFLKSSNDIEDDFFLTEEGKKIGFSLKEYYQFNRNSIDKFLGKNACYKIFGDSNYFEMYDELFDELKPMMEKAGAKVDEHYKNLRKKYGNRAQRRSRKEL